MLQTLYMKQPWYHTEMITNGVSTRDRGSQCSCHNMLSKMCEIRAIWWRSSEPCAPRNGPGNENVCVKTSGGNLNHWLFLNEYFGLNIRYLNKTYLFYCIVFAFVLRLCLDVCMITNATCVPSYWSFIIFEKIAIFYKCFYKNYLIVWFVLF